MEVNNDEVICPNCVTQFRAIPVNVQDLMRSQAAEIERLKGDVSKWLVLHEDTARLCASVQSERDQLKAKMEQLTSGDVELPEPAMDAPGLVTGRMVFRWYAEDQLIDYGNRRAAQAVTEFLERSGKYLTNDATREAAIKAAVLAERERCAQVANQQVMTSWNAKTDAHNTCALNIVSAIRKGEQA